MTYNERIQKIMENLEAKAADILSMAEAAEQQGAADFQTGKADDFESEDEAAYMYVSSFVEQEGRAELLV